MNRKIKLRNTFVYVVLRSLIILTIIFAVIDKDYETIFTCVLALILFTIPNFIGEKLNIELPNTLESVIYLFIFGAQILGEVRNFYALFPYWDTMLHTINGFIFAGIGFSICDLLNKNKKAKLYLSPIYVSVVAVLFSVSIGTFWEFLEYNLDNILHTDTQKDTIVNNLYTVSFNNVNKVQSFNDIEKTEVTYLDGEVLVIESGYLDIGLNDTMHDMLVNFYGAVVFSIFGYMYEKGANKYEFAKNFIPRKKEKNDE